MRSKVMHYYSNDNEPYAHISYVNIFSTFDVIVRYRREQ